LSNCANAVSTPSTSFPVDVSSIGSVMRRLATLEEQFNHDAGHDIRVLTHAIDFFVCQIDTVVP
jgi:hypothetical protein